MSHCLWDQLADHSATSAQLYSLPVWQLDGTRQMLSHPLLSTLHRHKNWRSQEGQKLWPDAENVRLSEILNRIFSKFYNFHQQLAVGRVSVVFKW